MPDPSDLPPEIQALLGTPCSEEPCDQCRPHPNVTCQVSKDALTPVWVPAQIVNADAGHLIMVPSSGDGPIGALLLALEPAQHYSHEAMMIEDRFTLRHCTSSADYLKLNPQEGGGLFDDNPTDGFTETAMRYGWPGTVTQSVDEAYRSSRGQNDATHVDYTGGGTSATLSTNLPSTRRPSPSGDLPVEGMDFDPVMAPVALGADAEALFTAIMDDNSSPDDLEAITRNATVTWETLWPLVVKPCPHNSPPHIIAALRRVAAGADYLHSHYRYHAYVDGKIGEDPAYNGPVMDDPARPVPGNPCGAKETWDHSIALVSSVFLWEAVQEANRRALGPKIFLTHPTDVTPQHNCAPFYATPSFSPDVVDGLFDYTQRQTQRAAISLAANIENGIASGQHDLPWYVSWLGWVYEAFSDIKDDVTDQICNAFASDECDPDKAIGDDSWKHPPAATSVSPDNIIGSWMAPLTTDPGPEIHGLYGYNERVVLRPGHYEKRPTNIWGFSPGPGVLEGLVTYNGQPAVGARMTLACQITYTNSDGYYRFDNPAGRYLLEGTLYIEQPVPQPAWCAQGTAIAEVPLNASHWLNIVLTDPPGENRIVQVSGHADLVNRHTFGHDWWDHPPMNFKQIHLGNYFTAEGDEQKASWGSTIDDAYGVGVEVTATRLTGSGADPYPVKVHVKSTLGNHGWSGPIPPAGWPFTPMAVNEFDLTIPTDGTAGQIVDLKTGAIAPVRAHLEMTFANYRQG